MLDVHLGIRARVAVAVVVAAGALVMTARPSGQVPGERPAEPAATSFAVAGQRAADLDRQLAALDRIGALRLSASVEDVMLEGRVHDRLQQYVGEARVFGGEVVRQRSANGVEAILGQIYQDLRLDARPMLTAEQAAARAAALTGRAPVRGRSPELVVLPLDDGSFRLTWYMHVLTRSDLLALFVDARTGEETLRFSDLRSQAAVGTGTGVLNDRKKVSARQSGGMFFADDALRPPALLTYDLKGSPERTLLILDGDLAPSQSDIASDTDNTWTDGAVVDAHAYVGFTYDYYFKRFQRRGVDNNDRRVRAIVHPANRDDLLTYPDEIVSIFMLNAFWCGACGSDGNGYMLFGEGLPQRFFLTGSGQSVTYFSAGFDIVAHEFTHGVTQFTSNLIGRNEPGALNEAFSDMMAVGADFFTAGSGGLSKPANYVLGEDVFVPFRPGSVAGTRSLSDPMSVGGQPDHYSRRFTGPEDNGGVHINATIPGHAFFLAIEGGTNRTSGIIVTGVGAANRVQIERVFYRAFTQLLPSSASFSLARQATLQAASDLFGTSSPAFRAVADAWTAVGVQ
jgi:Zn-dependent metalloprotease